jgi:glycosyltransferase involved in cell wall biosynthesis
MKVLLVNKYYYRRGGAEAHLLDLQRLLEERGEETVVFSMHHPRNLPSSHSEHFVSTVDYHTRSLGHRLRAGARLLFNFEARARIGNLLEAEAPDVAHLHNIYHQLSPSILPVLRERGLGVVLTVHDLKLVCPSYRMLAHGRPCERCLGGRFHHAAFQACHEGSRLNGALLGLEMYLHRFLRSYEDNVDLYLCPSRFYRDKLLEAGLPGRRLELLPYFLDAAGYRPAGGAGEDLVYFGRLSPEKGLSTLIAALARLPRARLRVIGEGPERETLQRQAAPLGERVRFTGFLAGEALHAAVRRARACVVPSEWYENFPVSVLESYALGRPVVAARIGGLPEMVRPGQTGWLFEPGNVESLVETLEEALSASNPTEMGERCRAEVEAGFSPERFYEKLQRIYATVPLSG